MESNQLLVGLCQSNSVFVMESDSVITVTLLLCQVLMPMITYPQHMHSSYQMQVPIPAFMLALIYHSMCGAMPETTEMVRVGTLAVLTWYCRILRPDTGQDPDIQILSVNNPDDVCACV